MQKDISTKPRPTIPYEHPDAAMYLKLCKENLIRLRNKKPAYSMHDETIRQVFDSDTGHTSYSLQEQCEQLVRYIAEAFEHYAIWDYTHAYYPGRPSQQTARTDAMEGVSRVIPTLAAWLHANGQVTTVINGLNNKAIDVAGLLRTAFLAGTDPEHKGYWGQLHDYDQRICESADLALALWLSKEWVWESFSLAERKQVATWFKQVNTCQTVDNNWHLFPLTVQLVIKDLTGEDTIAHDKYARVKEFYVGDGWFRDGARGNYDYYNAWGFFYSLYWLDQINPDFDPEFIRHSLTTFVDKFRYFFTPEGLPFFGRSVCYRLAASAPLLAAIDVKASSLSVGEAKRAFRTSLEYFISQGALEHGAPTQGVFADDARLVDNYSGPASSFWSLRALNIALFSGHRSGLWQAEESRLEVEKGDFSFEIPAIEASVIGTFKTKEVVVIFHSDYILQQTPLTRRLEPQSWLDRVLERLVGRAERPKNNLLRKGVTCYTSKMFHFF
ncbi:hypothetical protein C9J12_28495 [Photobacterium frigidiphilum]|uniref:DUF2264 domain-containing protein n=1 Tax=Photobacterium frigidiphilum TaxID=264736 RepID=A0A2T3J691_9GAMM|nr:DUF2264 domain-containing protein [Photobacterium frigidiphilum]PSU43014.1 hypothetical protein C9J12_28495 [Photobacterium frigidiphilum]